MTFTHRTCTGLNDLKKIQDFLRSARKILPHNYPHPGDVEWWLFYNPYGDVPENFIHLWEDEHGTLAAFVVLTGRRNQAAIFVHPAHQPGDLPALLVDWCEPRIQVMTSTVKEEGFEEVFAGDTRLISLLEQRGYTHQPFLTYFTRDLALPLPEIRLPEGFHFLDRMQLEFAENRANAHFSAFEPSRMTPDYYRGFMNAPMYDPELDIVAVAPDGRFAAFAMGWADPILKMSVFEPVGTHQDFQRKGLGTAVLGEGMRRLKARGMETATVCCETDNAGNQAFYQNAGFTVTAEIVNYMKPRPEALAST